MFRFLFVSILISSCGTPGQVAKYAVDGYVHDEITHPLERKIDVVHHHVLANRDSIARLEQVIHEYFSEKRERRRRYSLLLGDE